MNFKEYIDCMNKLIKTNPETATYTVVYAADDEGNDFDKLEHVPSIGMYKDREFYDKGYSDEPEFIANYVPDAICIN